MANFKAEGERGKEMLGGERGVKRPRGGGGGKGRRRSSGGKGKILRREKAGNDLRGATKRRRMTEPSMTTAGREQ